MTRITAILIGTVMFGSVYGGALANEHLPDHAKPIPIEWVLVKPSAPPVAQAIPKPKPAKAYTVADLEPDQRKLYYALLSSSCEAIRGCRR